MKKLILSFVAILVMTISAQARDVYSRDTSVLPKAAQTTVKKSFKAGISLIKIDKDLFDTDYEVVLTDGTEVKFDDKGNWTDVECPAGKSVPDAFDPASIRQWVKANHKGTRIVGIEKDRKGYEVQLENGIEAKFNTQGAFKRYDD